MNTQALSGLHYPSLSKRIVETPLDGYDWRSLCDFWPSYENPRVVLPIEEGSHTAVAKRLGEGEEIPLMYAPVAGKEVKAYKIGRGHRVTSEMIRYQQFPMVEHLLHKQGLVMHNTVNTDISLVIGAGIPAANVVACTGSSLMPGANNLTWVLTIPNTIGQYDILTAKRILRQNYKDVGGGKGVLMVNAVGMEHIERLPHYNSANMYGESKYQNGFSGRVSGCQVITSELVPVGVAYMIATDPTSMYTKQYTPVLFFVESRKLETYPKKREENDAIDIYSLWEYCPVVAYGEGMAKLEYAAFSS